MITCTHHRPILIQQQESACPLSEHSKRGEQRGPKEGELDEY